jgi:hypothetical protein
MAKGKKNKSKGSSSQRLRSAIANAGRKGKKGKRGRSRSGSGKIGLGGWLLAGGVITLNQPLVHFGTNKTRLFEPLKKDGTKNGFARFQGAVDTGISTGLAAGELAIAKGTRKYVKPTLILGGLLTASKALQGVSDWIGDSLDDATKSEETKAKYGLKTEWAKKRQAAKGETARKAGPDGKTGTADDLAGFDGNGGLQNDPGAPGTGMNGLDEDAEAASWNAAGLAGTDPILWKWANRLAAA